MVTTAAHVQWTVVATEVEALQLEYNWIKEFDPRFNVRYRDDKTYPVLAVTVGEEFPRLHVYRGPRRKGVRYFGPYAHAWAIRETLDLLLRVFPARTCSAGVFKRHGQIGRPCLLGYIDKCSAPCVGRVERRRAPRHRRRLLRLPRGPHGPAHAASWNGGWSRRRRSWSSSGRPGCATTSGRCAAPWSARPSCSATARTPTSSRSPQDELEAAVQVFHVRGGRVRGQRGWVIDKVEPTETPALVERFLTQFYGEQAALAESADDAGQPVPRGDPRPGAARRTSDALAEWLCGAARLPRPACASRSAATSGRWPRPSTATPRRPSPSTSCAARATSRPAPRRCRRSRTRSGWTPRRCASSASTSRTCRAPTSSPRWSCSRTGWRASRTTGASRSAAVRRAATSPRSPRSTRRRFRRYLAETADGAERAVQAVTVAVPVPADSPREYRRSRPATSRRHGPGIDPDDRPAAPVRLPAEPVVVDGGPPRSRRPRTCWPSSAITDVAVCGLAKRLEEVWLPADPDPVILSRTSEGLYLLQRSGTRRTGSPSPTTASVVPRA